MPRPTLKDVYAVGDLALQSRYTFEVGVVPGGGYSASKKLSVKCTTAQLPNLDTELIEVKLFGHKRVFRGTKSTSNLLAVTYLEDVKGDSFRLLYNWHEAVVGMKTGDTSPKAYFNTALTGKSSFLDNVLAKQLPAFAESVGLGSNTRLGKSNYATDSARLTLYDDANDEVFRVNFYGLFIKSIDNVDLAIAANEVIAIPVTYAFDYFVLEDFVTNKTRTFVDKKINQAIVNTPIADFSKKLQPFL